MTTYIEYTVAIETEQYTDWLVITLPKGEKLTDEVVRDEFERYSQDEAGEHMHGEELTDWILIRKG